MKQHWKFFASAAAALVWLWVSAALAVPLVRGAALHLPFAYVVFVGAGVALLPAYLMGAMFLSNLLHRKLPPRFHPGCRPVSVIVCARTWVQKMQFWDYFVSIAAIKRYQGSYGATLVAQGAFSAYETAAVRAAGGWTDGAGEDIVHTYRLLAAGRRSLYEPRAVGFTDVPTTLGALARQRSRWARGMFEGLAAVKPWSQPDAFAGYFETLNLSIVWLDLAYIFGFVPGVALALLGMPWLAGWLTLLVLPLMLIGTVSVCRFQRRLPEMEAKGSAWGFLLFVLVFQVVQSACSLWGYAAALTRRGIDWKR